MKYTVSTSTIAAAKPNSRKVSIKSKLTAEKPAIATLGQEPEPREINRQKCPRTYQKARVKSSRAIDSSGHPQPAVLYGLRSKATAREPFVRFDVFLTRTSDHFRR